MGDNSKPAKGSSNVDDSELFDVEISINDAVNRVLREKSIINVTPISDFYKPKLVAKALNKLEATGEAKYIVGQGEFLYINKNDIKQKLIKNIDKLQAFYNKQKQRPLAVTTHKIINDGAALKLSKYFKTTKINPGQWRGKTTKTKQDTNGQPITGYVVINKQSLNKVLESLEPTNYRENNDVNILTSQEDIKSLYSDVISLSNACGIIDDSEAMITIDKLVFKPIHNEVSNILAEVLGIILDEHLRAKPEPLELFSNTVMGLDATKVTARHELFRSLDRGLRKMGSEEIYKLYTSNKEHTITIPHNSSGIKSVYQITVSPRVNMGGFIMPTIESETDAKRLAARTIKTQLLIYAWSIHTGSFSINNAKVSDMLKVAGLEGRIKREDYIDITKGLLNLKGTTYSISADRYYNKELNKTMRLGKNESYGNTITPLGSTEVIWHTEETPYYYTDDEYKALDGKLKEALELKDGEPHYYTDDKYETLNNELKNNLMPTGKTIVKDNKEQKEYRKKRNVYYKILNKVVKTVKKKDGKEQKVTSIEYERRPVYVKKLIYARVAEGMKDPNQHRATLFSRGLMNLNTHQQGHYILLGSEIANLYEQYQPKTIKGEPITLRIITILDYLGFSTAEHLRKASETKQKMIKALDTLRDKPVNHIGEWGLNPRDGKLQDIDLTKNSYLNKTILIYPPTYLINSLKASNNEPDKAMLKILKYENRNRGKTETAKVYGINVSTLEDILAGRAAIAACLPPNAYQLLKARADE